MKSGGRSIARDRLPRNIVDLYEKYSFQAFDNRGAWAYDTPREWYECMKHVDDALLPALHLLEQEDPPLATAEIENLEKMQVCWRDKGLGSLVQPADLEVSNEEQARALESELRKIGLRLVTFLKALSRTTLTSIYYGAAIPANKGKGAPYWIPGSNPAAAIYFARIADTAQSLAELDDLILSIGPADNPMCATTYMRIQGSRKDQDRWVLAGDELEVSGTRKGPKVRKIQALPFAYNYRYAGLTEIIKYAMMHSDDQHTGRIDTAISEYSEYNQHIAADLSNYDDSVSIETLDIVRDAIIMPCAQVAARAGVISGAELHTIADIDAWLQIIKLLTPPISRHEAGRLVRTIGGIKSGEKPTSLKGTLVNEARIRAKARALGLKIRSFNQGDDTIVYSNDASLDTRWFDNQMFGFTETRGEDLSYLMKRIPQGYGYLTRMVTSNINREPAHESAGLFSAASAMRIRYELLKGHPLQHMYYDSIPNTGRLTATKQLAAQTDIPTLLDGMVAEHQTGEGREDLETYIDDGLALGLISRVTATALRRQIQGIYGRSTFTLGEARAESLRISRGDAVTALKAMIYRGRYRRTA